MAGVFTVSTISAAPAILGAPARAHGARIPVRWLVQQNGAWTYRSWTSGPAIWESNPGFVLPPTPDTSNRPVAFVFDKNIAPLTVPLTFRGTYNFAAAGLTEGTYVISGVDNNGMTLISQPTKFPADNNVEVTGFSFDPTFQPVGPFKCGGDWTWTITSINTNPAKPPLPSISTQTTRLEMFFVLGHIRRTFIADLLRFALMPAHRIRAGALVNDAPGYASYITRALWNFGGNNKRYDVWDGAAFFSYISNALCPWDFDLTIIKNPAYLANCHDLAASLMLLCGEVGSEPVAAGGGGGMTYPNFIRCTYVFQYPFGYIRPGPLWGLTAADQEQCNSPFWFDANGNALPINYDAAHLLDRDRRKFDRHGYLEYLHPTGQPRVLDTCHAIYVAPGTYNISDGGETFNQYIRAVVDAGFFFPTGWAGYSGNVLIQRTPATGAFITNTRIRPL